MIPQHTTVALGVAAGGLFHVYSADLDDSAHFTLSKAPDQHFAQYVYGCLKEAEVEGARIPPLNICVQSEVPMGVGLSSSAALEVATLRALRQLLDLTLDDIQIAKLAQRAEIRHAGVNCGILDQMASSLLSAGKMLFLDTRTLDRHLLPLPADSEILVIDSGQSRSLAGTEYNQRRAACEEAARQLGVPALRDIKSSADLESLPEPLRRRARHVVCENARVLQAAGGASAARLGELMNASHRSLRDYYEVSTAALDTLVELMQAQSVTYGAKLTGAGFGGACVALCEAGSATEAARDILAAYGNAGYSGTLLVPTGGPEVIDHIYPR